MFSQRSSNGDGSSDFEKGRSLLVKLLKNEVPSRQELIRSIQECMNRVGLNEPFELHYPLPVSSDSKVIDVTMCSFIITCSNNDAATKFRGLLKQQMKPFKVEFFLDSVYSEVSAKVSSSVLHCITQHRLADKVWPVVKEKWCNVVMHRNDSNPSRGWDDVTLVGSLSNINLAMYYLRDVVAAEILDAASSQSNENMTSFRSKDEPSAENMSNKQNINEQLLDKNSNSFYDEATMSLGLSEDEIMQFANNGGFDQVSDSTQGEAEKSSADGENSHRSNSEKATSHNVVEEASKVKATGDSEEEMEEGQSFTSPSSPALVHPAKSPSSIFIPEDRHNRLIPLKRPLFNASNSGSHTSPLSSEMSAKRRKPNLATYHITHDRVLQVYVGDITEVDVDVVVNAANGQLRHGGGVARAIADAAGDELVRESKRRVSQKGELKVSEVVFTTAGRMKCTKVLHAVGPRFDDYTKQEQEQKVERVLRQTILNCLKVTSSAGYLSMAMPLISAGIYGCPLNLVVRCMMTAICDAWRGEKGLTVPSVKEIHIVDINKTFINEVTWFLEKKLGIAPTIAEVQEMSSNVSQRDLAHARNSGRDGGQVKRNYSKTPSTGYGWTRAELDSDDDDILEALPKEQESQTRKSTHQLTLDSMMKRTPKSSDTQLHQKQPQESSSVGNTLHDESLSTEPQHQSSLPVDDDPMQTVSAVSQSDGDTTEDESALSAHKAASGKCKNPYHTVSDNEEDCSV